MTTHPFTHAVAFADLSQWSPWPARLAGHSDWKRSPRTADDITREYDVEKYGMLLEYLDAHPASTIEQLKQIELGNDPKREICIAVGEDLYQTTLEEAQRYADATFLTHITPALHEADVVCDLGCGYGYHLALLRERFPDKRFVGGEYAASGVSMAAVLFPDKGISVMPFDFHDPAFVLPFGKDDRVLVFTAYAIEQLPVADGALRRLADIRGSAWNICHFEPVFGYCSDSPLGRLRRTYTLANDYNRDLLAVLESRDDIHIDVVDKEYFGMNPLHPVSFVRWH